jgi:hypothetical protein
MNPINPWLDPIEVRRLAERLMRPTRSPDLSVKDAGFDATFIGYATEPTEPPRPPAQAPQPQNPMAREPAAPVIEQPAPKSPESLASSARGPFLERIRRFSDWMKHQFAASGVFILDREGSVIFDESNHSRLHFLARSLALASRRQGSSTNVHVKIGAGATLEVIPVETAYGCLVLGAVLPESMPPDAVTVVIDALSQVATPPEA